MQACFAVIIDFRDLMASYSSMSACTGALCSRQEEAKAAMPPCIAQMVSSNETLYCPKGCSTFQIMEVMDAGGFATVLKGRMQANASGVSQLTAAKVAVDLEIDGQENLTDHQRGSFRASMRHEYNMYKRLQSNQDGNSGIPLVYFAGAVKRADDPKCPKKQYLLSYMVMELLGPSIGHLSLELQCYKNNTTLLVQHGLGMLKVLEHMHQNSIVHRDIKPDNFCLPHGCLTIAGSNSALMNSIYIVDMGMAQHFRENDFPWERTDCLYTGTVDYSSVRSLHGYHPCAWDDLESLAITLLEMADGRVPFDLVQDDGPLTVGSLQAMAVQKEKLWQHLLSKPETPHFIKQWMRHLRSVPPKLHPCKQDYTALQEILCAALSPPSSATTNTWSTEMYATPLKAASTMPAKLPTNTKKRSAPAMSAASSLPSSMSEAACVIQPKRTKFLHCLDGGGADDDMDESGSGCVSTTTGLLGLSQVVLVNQVEE